MMEDPEKRKAMDKAELQFFQDTRKEELFALKEELFFTIDEKAHEADLTRAGPRLSESGRSGCLRAAGSDQRSSPRSTWTRRFPTSRRRRRKSSASSIATRRRSAFTTSRSSCAPIAFSRRTSQYVVEENKVVIVDEYTGRKMPGRRWSDGLHQAVEAKEGVQIDRETQTLATITIQNYFRLYHKLAGMTGTAETEAAEFHDIYKLDVAVIPTNRPCARKDANDRIYKTRREKYNAVIKEIKERHAQAPAGPRRHGERRSVASCSAAC